MTRRKMVRARKRLNAARRMQPRAPRGRHDPTPQYTYGWSVGEYLRLLRETRARRYQEVIVMASNRKRALRVTA